MFSPAHSPLTSGHRAKSIDVSPRRSYFVSNNFVFAGSRVHVLLQMPKRISVKLRSERVFDDGVTHGGWKKFQASVRAWVEICSRNSSESSPVEKELNNTPKEGTMVKLQAFQIAARKGAFVKMSEGGDGNVLWFRKRTADTTTQTRQRMCIDSLTNSVTVYRMTAPAKVNSKTFRAVPALQEWFKLSQEAIVQR
jgi:hypothetical protein